MERKIVVSERKVKSRAALLGMTLGQLNEKAGFGEHSIYRMWGKDRMTLNTLTRIANVLQCDIADLLEESEGERGYVLGVDRLGKAATGYTTANFPTP